MARAEERVARAENPERWINIVKFHSEDGLEFAASSMIYVAEFLRQQKSAC